MPSTGKSYTWTLGHDAPAEEVAQNGAVIGVRIVAEQREASTWYFRRRRMSV
jgi:hypothetical protein